jgi:hypothetical protein
MYERPGHSDILSCEKFSSENILLFQDRGLTTPRKDRSLFRLLREIEDRSQTTARGELVQLLKQLRRKNHTRARFPWCTRYCE